MNNLKQIGSWVALQDVVSKLQAADARSQGEGKGQASLGRVLGNPVKGSGLRGLSIGHLASSRTDADSIKPGRSR